MIKFPFEVTDINFMGYDLLDDHFDEVCEMMHLSWKSQSTDVDDEHGTHWLINQYDDEQKLMMIINGAFEIDYLVRADTISLDMTFFPNEDEAATISSDNLSRYTGSFPIMPGDTYEYWCNIMQADAIKERWEQYQDGYFCREGEYNWAEYREIRAFGYGNETKAESIEFSAQQRMDVLERAKISRRQYRCRKLMKKMELFIFLCHIKLQVLKK